MNPLSKIVGVFFILFLIFDVNLTAQNIPNFSFENWGWINYEYDPVGWTSMNFGSTPLHIISVCERDPDHTVGNYSVKLTVKNDSVLESTFGGNILSSPLTIQTMGHYPWFPFHLRPDTLKGDWKFHSHFVEPNCNIQIVLSKWDGWYHHRDTIGYGIVMEDYFDQPQWIEFSCAINYFSTAQPDSAAIYIATDDAGNPTLGDFIKVDNLHFTFPVGVNELTMENDVQIFPNPNDGIFTVKWDALKSEAYTLTLFNCQGMEVFRTRCVNVNEYKFSDLKPGIYFLKGESKDNTFIKKVVVY